MRNYKKKLIFLLPTFFLAYIVTLLLVLIVQIILISLVSQLNPTSETIEFLVPIIISFASFSLIYYPKSKHLSFKKYNNNLDIPYYEQSIFNIMPPLIMFLSSFFIYRIFFPLYSIESISIGQVVLINVGLLLVYLLVLIPAKIPSSVLKRSHVGD